MIYNLPVFLGTNAQQPKYESQDGHDLTTQNSKLFPTQNAKAFSSQYSCNITYANTSSLSIPKIKVHSTDKPKTNLKDPNDLYVQVQSSPLLNEEPKDTKPSKVVPPMIKLKYGHLLGENREWSWKSMDDIYISGNCPKKSIAIEANAVAQSGTLYRKDVFYSGSVYHLKDVGLSTSRPDLQSPLVAENNMDNMLGKDTVCVEIHEDKASKVVHKVVDIMKEMTNFSLFTDPVFVVYTVSCTLTMFGKCPSVPYCKF